MDLRRRIEEAFGKTPRPAPDEITGPCRCDECQEIAEYFRGTDWRGHPVRGLRIHAAALSLFTPAAYRYWLPAFMLAELEDAETADVIAESIAFDFTESMSRDARVREFTRAELTAVAAFFEECVRRYSDSFLGADAFRRAADAVRTASEGTTRAAIDGNQENE